MNATALFRTGHSHWLSFQLGFPKTMNAKSIDKNIRITGNTEHDINFYILVN